MLESWPERLARELEELRAKNRFRSLNIYSGIDFGSNDYLGFATDAELKEEAIRAFQNAALSSSASRLLPGHHAEHSEAERIFAEFVGSESALFFNSGYDANHALLSTLPTRHDLILYDERSHASIYDGVHSSVAKSRRFKHNSHEELRRILETCEMNGNVFIVLESVYSMDGDVAHLAEIATIAKEFGAILMVDEAHATGIMGTRGEGLVTELLTRTDTIISIHTCGKALGAAGAFVCGSRIVTEYLTNKARPFIFTTALPPIVPLHIIAAIQKLGNEGTSLVTAVRNRSGIVRNELQRSLARWIVPDGITPIISIIIGRDRDALNATRILERKGFDIPAIRPPTVPEGTARLRMNVSLRHSEWELRSIIDSIITTEKELVLSS